MGRLGRALGRFRARRGAARAARRNRATGTRCAYCGVAFEGSGARSRTVDHRLPRSRGGTDGLANLVFACRACNQRKADRPEPEFLASPWLRDRRRAVGGDGPTP